MFNRYVRPKLNQIVEFFKSTKTKYFRSLNEQNRRLYTLPCGIRNIGKTHPAVAEEKWLLDFECFGDIGNLVSLVLELE